MRARAPAATTNSSDVPDVFIVLRIFDAVKCPGCPAGERLHFMRDGSRAESVRVSAHLGGCGAAMRVVGVEARIVAVNFIIWVN